MRLIDADALIAWLKKAGNYLKSLEDSKELTRVIGKIIDHVEAMPTIEQPKWISCAKRLPTENGKYLVVHEYTFWNRGKRLTMSIEFFSTELCGWFCDGRLLTNVTHWMPLPQPPKGDE